jgi:hypothetical protein
MNRPRSSASLTVMGNETLYAFGGYPLSNHIEMFIRNFSYSWRDIILDTGDHIVHSFWAGSYPSDKNDGVIFIFGGGQKYSDTCDCYEFHTHEKSLKKFNLLLPKDDRFFYNQKIKLDDNKIVTFGRHGVYKLDFEKRTCFRLEEGYRGLEQKEQ